MSKCEYCILNKPIVDTYCFGKNSESHGIDLIIFDNILEITASGDTYEPNFEETEIKINYCPMCGRKLGD